MSTKPKKLTTKQQRFVDAYDGNATAAAIAAGYSQRTAASIGQENLTKPEIIEAIQQREADRRAQTIMTREERQAFWSETIRDGGQQTRDRLRASELLGRSEGDFIDRQEVKAEIAPTLPPSVLDSHIIIINSDDSENCEDHDALHDAYAETCTAEPDEHGQRAILFYPDNHRGDTRPLRLEERRELLAAREIIKRYGGTLPAIS